MTTHYIQVTRKSRNSKTGDIPVTTTSEESCPHACPLKGNGCYAEGGPLAILWRKVTARKAGMAWDAAMSEIAALPQVRYGATIKPAICPALATILTALR